MDIYDADPDEIEKDLKDWVVTEANESCRYGFSHAHILVIDPDGSFHAECEQSKGELASEYELYYMRDREEDWQTWSARYRKENW